jgi:hypothetical protein
MATIPEGCDPRSAATRLRQEAGFLSDQARECLIRAQELLQTAEDLDPGAPVEQGGLGDPAGPPPRMRGPEQPPRQQLGDEDLPPNPRTRGRR